jgi:hypothetical protein
MVRELDKQFGLIIAFLLPGFVGLWGITYINPTIRSWFVSSANLNATVGGFLFVILGSLAIGLIFHSIRYFILDNRLFKEINNKCSGLDISKLNSEKREQFFSIAVENHYRYHNYYGNMAIAIVFAYSVRCLGYIIIKMYFWTNCLSILKEILLSILSIALVYLLIRSSKDCFNKYAVRAMKICNQKREGD